jgi:hypothetical protein
MAFNLREIFQALADCDYVVVGGLAVLLHGHLRATRDIDLVIALGPDNCRKALAALASVGLRPRLPVKFEDFADAEKRRDWYENRNMVVFPLWDPGNAQRAVDLFVKVPDETPQLFERAATRDIDGIPVRIASIPDLIAMKRSVGRPQDLDDIVALREIAKETGVTGDDDA